MSPSKKSALAKKIAQLGLKLAPLVPLPEGPPHPAFPATLLAYHLLTEEELDDIAHYYHQSTPGFWTDQYPTTMNWDKSYLNHSRDRKTKNSRRRQSQPTISANNGVDLHSLFQDQVSSPTTERRSSRARRWSAAGLTDAQRIAIKRRKVGKFIGMHNMETPIAEIEGRIQHTLDQAMALAREERRIMEEFEMSGRKV